MQNLHTQETKESNLKYGDRTPTPVDSQAEGVDYLEGVDRKVHPDEGFDPAEIKRIRRKIDWRLVPPLAALYMMSLIDRTVSTMTDRHRRGRLSFQLPMY